MDLSSLLQMAQQVKEQLSQAQNATQSLRAEGEAGGGLVKVVMNGQQEVLEVHIDSKAVDKASLSLLEDLVRAACNNAHTKIVSQMQNNLGNIAKNMGLDLSALNLPGFK